MRTLLIATLLSLVSDDSGACRKRVSTEYPSKPSGKNCLTTISTKTGISLWIIV